METRAVAAAEIGPSVRLLWVSYGMGSWVNARGQQARGSFSQLSLQQKVGRKLRNLRGCSRRQARELL